MSPRLARLPGVVIAAVFLGAAAYYVFVELHRPGMVASDTYDYFIPNAVHALRSLSAGGKGLFWNPFQSCGGPFFANGVTGVLNPQYLPFLVLEPNAAVHAVLMIDMVLGAIGMLLLARQLGLSRVAAAGGALAFGLGDPMKQFIGWDPFIAGAWVWLPWALLACERLLRAPTRRGVVALTAVLTLQLLTGYVHTVALTYQLIAMRVGWELLTQRGHPPWRATAAIAAGGALAPLMAAVQLFPYIEFAAESFRVEIPVDRLLSLHSLSLSTIWLYTSLRAPPLPFLVAPVLLAVVAPFAAATRRLAIFYLVLGVLFALFGLGDRTPLLQWYVHLPPGGRVLRVPNRLFWVSGFSLSVLTALALQLLAESRSGRRPRWALAIASVTGALGLAAVAPGGLRAGEAAALVLLVVALLTASLRPERGRAAAWVALAALALNLSTVSLRWKGRFLDSAEVLWTHAGTFAALDPPLSAQDRVFMMPDFLGVARGEFAQRTATLLGVPNLSDYDTIPRRRFADYFTMMRKGKSFTTIADGYGPFPWLTADIRPRLLDLAAVRYLLASPSTDLTMLADLPRAPVAAELQIFRNDRALPRARYVPRVEVVPEPGALLHRLAFGDDDLSTLALIEEPPPSGFTGQAAPHGTPPVRFLTNEPEHIVIEVDAPQRGFLLLADQHYPGWHATVNGTATPILLGNYLFRLVEVPAGYSRVEFRYRSTYLALGAAVSAATALALAAVLWRGRARWAP